MKIRAEINPDILRWAREHSRLDAKIIAKRLGVKQAKYSDWEAGKSQPTINQFYKLVRLLNRPLQDFFLEEPPEEDEVLAEMRRLPGAEDIETTPEFAEQLDLALQRRETALRLYEELGERPPRQLFHPTSARNDPEDLAVQIRSYLAVSSEEQIGWSNPHAALRGWRHAAERVGILVFQIPGVSLQEMRGFAISFKPLPIIGINSKDWPRARIFTLLHELIHIALGENTLEAPKASWFSLSANLNVEHFCNTTAGAVVLPLGQLRDFVDTIAPLRTRDWTEEEATKIARRFKVSRSVVIRRLRSANLISGTSFDRLRHAFDRFAPPVAEESGGDPYSNKLAQLGHLYPELAFRAHYSERLPLSELSLLLGLRASKLGELEERVTGFRYTAGGR